MSVFRIAARAAIVLSAFWFVPSQAFGQVPANVSALDVDRSVRPGEDFYGYANGAWIKANQGQGRAVYDTRTILNEKTGQRVRDLVQGAVLAKAAKDSATQKVGDYYAGFMDLAAIEAKGMKPLDGEMAAIARIRDRVSLSAYLGTTLNSEVDGLTANADHVFGVWINQGFEDAEHNLPHIWQGGLGLPDRENYLDTSAKMAEQRGQYQAHIAAMLKLAGVADADAKAAKVLALETMIARAFAPDEDAADVFKQNNPWARGEFGVRAPGMDWESYFKAAGLGSQMEFVVWQPSAVTGVAALVAGENVAVWKDYLRFHLIEHYAAVLPKAVRDEHFAFYGKILGRAQEAGDRSPDAVAAVNGALPHAVGQLYTQKYFSAAAKARAEAMGADLIEAYRARIANLKWMTPATKEKALAKLAAFKLVLGYPDVWIDYSTLEVAPGDAFGNMRRAEAFNQARNLAQLKKPVDPIDWPINPQVQGAVIMFSPNAEFFTAAILQPPYFDPDGDAASNYGSAGAGMAHEIAHSFDELGNLYDDKGRLSKWWTAQDKAAFDAAVAGLVAQVNAYCPSADVCEDGKHVQTETVADLAGLVVAHDAYLLSLKGKPDVVIGGLTGEQRFFLAFAQRWRRIQSDERLKAQIKTDTHLAGPYRSAEVRNVDAWYDAFGITPADKLYVKPEERVRIW